MAARIPNYIRRDEEMSTGFIEMNLSFAHPKRRWLAFYAKMDVIRALKYLPDAGVNTVSSAGI